MRRLPSAFVAAHVIDPSRRSLFVEGRSDRLFFRWLSGKTSAELKIEEIADVELPDLGSNRQRVIKLAEEVGAACDRMMMIADTDLEPVPTPMPPQLRMTDHRDVESYLLRADCFEKVLRLGLMDDDLEARELLTSVMGCGRWLAALRTVMASHVPPVAVTDQVEFSKYLEFKNGILAVRKAPLVQALLQRAGVSLTEKASTLQAIEEAVAGLSAVADLDLVRGKDGVAVACFVFRKAKAKDPDSALRCSFEKSMSADYPVLTDIVAFISAA